MTQKPFILYIPMKFLQIVPETKGTTAKSDYQKLRRAITLSLIDKFYSLIIPNHLLVTWTEEWADKGMHGQIDTG